MSKSRRESHNIPEDHKLRMLLRRKKQRERLIGFIPMYTKKQLREWAEQQQKERETNNNADSGTITESIDTDA